MTVSELCRHELVRPGARLTRPYWNFLILCTVIIWFDLHVCATLDLNPVVLNILCIITLSPAPLYNIIIKYVKVCLILCFWHFHFQFIYIHIHVCVCVCTLCVCTASCINLIFSTMVANTPQVHFKVRQLQKILCFRLLSKIITVFKMKEMQSWRRKKKKGSSSKVSGSPANPRQPTQPGHHKTESLKRRNVAPPRWMHNTTPSDEVVRFHINLFPQVAFTLSLRWLVKKKRLCLSLSESYIRTTLLSSLALHVLLQGWFLQIIRRLKGECNEYKDRLCNCIFITSP